MSDTKYAVKSGFYDAINHDRLYSADDMNQPYKSMLSAGIIEGGFAVTPQSTPDMTVNVETGHALLGDKWVDAAAKTLTVPENSALYGRIDAVVLRVDINTGVRAADLIYRTGTPASEPEAPALIGTTGIYEVRLANITVAAGATAIAAAQISDQRGTSGCPYVTMTVGNNQIKAAVEDVLEEHPEWTTTVQDGSITLAKLASGVVDNTLTQAGAAADAKKTGDEISGLKDAITEQAVLFSWYEKASYSVVDNKLWNTITNSLDGSYSSFQYAIVPVVAGTKYRITGFGTNENAPRFWSDTEEIEQIATGGTYFVGVECVAPTGATQLLINGRDNGTNNLLVEVDDSSQKSKDFFKDFEEVKGLSKQIGVNVTANDVQVYQHGLLDGYDLFTWFRHKAMNNLLDIYGWYKVPNDSDEVVVDNVAFTRIGILAGATDFIQPFMIWAVNNGNGDFTDPSVRKFTGGWHGYDNHTDGEYSATAQTTNIKVLCDGKEVTSGNSERGNKVKVIITNRIQASNTEKSDGSGREVLEAKYVLTFQTGNGFIKVDCILKALEEININRMYGLAFYRSSTSDECRAIGSRSHREAFTLAESLDFDEYTHSIVEHCANGDVSVGIDPILDLGSGYASEKQMGACTGSGKAYMSMIFDNTFTATSGFNMDSGDEARWSGFYSIAPK